MSELDHQMFAIGDIIRAKYTEIAALQAKTAEKDQLIAAYIETARADTNDSQRRYDEIVAAKNNVIAILEAKNAQLIEEDKESKQ